MVTTVRAVIALVIVAMVAIVIAWSINNVYQKQLAVEEAKKEEEEARKELDRAMADLAETIRELNRLAERGDIN